MSKALSRKLRQNATPPERLMWALLKPLRDRGFHFRRQVQIGSYFVDFACLKSLLVIEVDGDTHGDALTMANDAVRDDYLHGRGFRVLRFWNNDVMRNPEGVFQVLETALNERVSPPTPDPSPQGGGEMAAVGAGEQTE